MSPPRAAVLITGTEVLGGWVQDRNGPWLARRLGELGVEHATTTVVGDRPEDMRAALDHASAQGLALVVTSGGLGPTEDDRTAEVVAGFSGRELELDVALEQRIWAIIEDLAARHGRRAPAGLREANRKQALVPRGATVIEPVGTAPGLVVSPQEAGAAPSEVAGGRGEHSGAPGPTVLVLPGPPAELQAMWETALGTPALRAAVRGATKLSERTLRLYGPPEAALAETMRDARRAGVRLDGLEINTCAHRGELEVVTRWRPGREEDERAFAAFVAARHGEALFSDDGRTVDEQVLGLLRDQGLRIATAESCTAGLVAGRLTDRPGSSDVVAGGIVAYADAVKQGALGVGGALLSEHGAVSGPVAEAMARGALERIGADVAVSTTGVAGPGGGSEEKPVGTVFIAVAVREEGGLVRRVRLPGGRAAVRERTVTAALHLLRRALMGERDAAD